MILLICFTIVILCLHCIYLKINKQMITYTYRYYNYYKYFKIWICYNNIKCGFIILKPNNTNLNIANVFIKRKYRRRGYYTLLLYYSANLALKNNFKYICSDTTMRSEYANLFWNNFLNKISISSWKCENNVVYLYCKYLIGSLERESMLTS